MLLHSQIQHVSSFSLGGRPHNVVDTTPYHHCVASLVRNKMLILLPERFSFFHRTHCTEWCCAPLIQESICLYDLVPLLGFDLHGYYGEFAVKLFCGPAPWLLQRLYLDVFLSPFGKYEESLDASDNILCMWDAAYSLYWCVQYTDSWSTFYFSSGSQFSHHEPSSQGHNSNSCSPLQKKHVLLSSAIPVSTFSTAEIVVAKLLLFTP